ncbi:class I SAM-dependent methyltransferase [Paractinoplanes maris]|uniref:class I SAM-dependent methyltransferase n=1 Tax=Paractinoplanes maris TaxID=1734446 RepID=UPI0020210644|nr:methyltransferase domain-containing protein [Actinoplanes maris]
MSDLAAFASEFVRAPMAVASVTPSGRALTQQVTSPVPASGDPVVVELGPGTGAFTQAIQTRLAGRGHHLAIELNPRFATLLATRFPQLEVVTADARELITVLATRARPHADVIVSGLPWAAFERTQQQTVLDAVAQALTPTGAFTTFAYVHARWTPPARRLRRALHDTFEEVVLGRTVWANLPPALVYHCRRART